MTRLVIFDLDGTLYDNGRLPLYVVLHSLCSLRMLKAERSVRTEISGTYFGQAAPPPTNSCRGYQSGPASLFRL